MEINQETLEVKTSTSNDNNTSNNNNSSNNSSSSINNNISNNRNASNGSDGSDGSDGSASEGNGSDSASVGNGGIVSIDPAILASAVLSSAIASQQQASSSAPLVPPSDPDLVQAPAAQSASAIESELVSTSMSASAVSESISTSTLDSAAPSTLDSKAASKLNSTAAAASVITSISASAPTLAPTPAPTSVTVSAPDSTAASTLESVTAATPASNSSSAPAVAKASTPTSTTASTSVSASNSTLGLNASAMATPPLVGPQLSDYLNYRDYLRAFYLYKREQTKNHLRPYNYSFFSVAADIKSPNYLRLVMEGQRNLSEEMALKFAKAMQLNKESSDEFLLLVLYSQETDPSLRNQYLKNLSDFRLQKSLKQGLIDKKTMERIPNWIGWILFSLIDQEGAQFNISQLKQLLRNKASEAEIQMALDKLLESGEIILNPETGEVKKGRSLIENSEDIPVVLIRRLQTQLMYMGLESLLQDSPTEREFGTLTLALTKQEYEDLRFQLRKFRKQIHKDNTIQRMKSKGERVYQMNLQLYPVTDRSQIIKDLGTESDK